MAAKAAIHACARHKHASGSFLKKEPKNLCYIDACYLE